MRDPIEMPAPNKSSRYSDLQGSSRTSTQPARTPAATRPSSESQDTHPARRSEPSPEPQEVERFSEKELQEDCGQPASADESWMREKVVRPQQNEHHAARHGSPLGIRANAAGSVRRHSCATARLISSSRISVSACRSSARTAREACGLSRYRLPCGAGYEAPAPPWGRRESPSARRFSVAAPARAAPLRGLRSP